MSRDVDPITLAVVRGVLETTQREMTMTLEKTARSSVFNVAHDYSNAIFNGRPEMILQGQDIPIHLGGLIPAMKAVAGFFGSDIHDGDIIYHNDPVYKGSHIVDCCMYKPVFYRGELVFWTVCKGHVTDIGGPVPAGYNPDAREIYAEGLRIPPVKLWEKGVERYDVVNFMLSNMRSRRDQEGDLKAQLGAVNVGARNLIALLDKYGIDTVRDCVDELMDMADRHMRHIIRAVPDGVYRASATLEDAGHGYGEIEIEATVTIDADTCHIAIESPPQIPYFINSYEGNSISGVYLGLMMFAQLDPPYNEGLYRCVSVDLGPKGTLCNAAEPAPHVNCTTTPMETLADAVRLALEQAQGERAVGSWGHSSGVNIAGHDQRTDDEYVTMVLASLVSGAGATRYMDGWHACGPQCCFGALYSGDIETLEYSYPILIHRYALVEDSAGAGEFRGGSGTVWEVEPIGHEMTVVSFGEGRKLPALGANGAVSAMPERKLGRVELKRHGKVTDTYRDNAVITVRDGYSLATYNPGGGGWGSPLRRDPERVRADVRNGIVSIDAARTEYGVVIDPESLRVDSSATRALRSDRLSSQHQ
ncbi:hydantoinase B/oxoprolinase family protein [Burkholderia pseudomultivorans]|uniref:Hydantoinase n=1 Tax=Burkholderia pseudomultivorans TaxID=1207504 RepID=A0A132ED80_9BURK|nr:hydantoinase B/oxoprolinase family protein [Burkholderia pseudomultivorans]KWF24763.1 hydantoinase [Burkholderia pseudomultivorans]